MENPVTADLPTQDEYIELETDEVARGRPELKAWENWQSQPNPTNLSNVLKSSQPVIDRAVKRYPHLNANLMRGKARSLAIQAVKTYNPTSGASLSTHIFNHLLPLGRYGTEMTRIVSVPRSTQDDVGRMVKAEKGFMEENNREPNDDELQDLLQMSGKKISRLRGASRYEFAEGQMNDLPAVADEDSTLSLWTDYVYQDLDPLGKAIMDHKMGRNGRDVLDTEAVAAKLKIHPTYVNRRAAKIAKQILDGVNSTREKY